MRFETSNEKLYRQYHPGMSFEKRIECLKWLKSLGYELGTGFLIGLPGQTIDDLAQDILLVKELDADMIGIGPFIPHPQTPLKDAKEGSVDLTLKSIAILRLLIPDANIPATTALGTLDPLGRQKGLMCGANIVMPNVNHLKYKLKYELYPGKICIMRMLQSVEAALSQSLFHLAEKWDREKDKAGTTKELLRAKFH